jgi:hypothetical protein
LSFYFGHCFVCLMNFTASDYTIGFFLLMGFFTYYDIMYICCFK